MAAAAAATTATAAKAAWPARAAGTTMTAWTTSSAESGRTRFGAAFLGVDGLSIQIGTVHFGDGGSGFGFGGHSDKPKAARLAGGSVPYDVDGSDLAEGFESLAQLVFGCLW